MRTGDQAGAQLVLAERRARPARPCPTSNVSGSAPYLSTLARSVASSWVKLPVICAWPPVIGRCSARRRHDEPVEHDAELVLGGCCWDRPVVVFSELRSRPSR